MRLQKIEESMRIILKLLQVIRMFGLSTALTTTGKLNTVKRCRSAEVLSGSLSSERSRRANVSASISLRWPIYLLISMLVKVQSCFELSIRLSL